MAEILNRYALKSQRRSFVCGAIFFFSSRRRHTRFDCDWSSDVCSSDLEETLSIGYALLRDLVHVMETPEDAQVVNLDLAPRLKAWASKLGLAGIERLKRDRKRVVWGKSVDLGGRRIIKKKKKERVVCGY